MIIVLTLGTFLSSTSSFAKENKRTATVIDFDGEVSLTKKGEKKEFTIFKDMKLSEGDTIITGKDSFVEILLDDDKEIKVGEDTKVDLRELKEEDEDEGEQTTFKVWRGKIWANIKKALKPKSNFEINTPTSVAGVRGTKFLVEYKDRTSNIHVVEGVVKTRVHTIEKGKDGKYEKIIVEKTLK